MMDLVQKEWLYNQQEKRKAEQERLYYYYIGRKSEIESMLTEALLKFTHQEDIEEMQLNWLNITKKMINQLSVVYREPAERRIYLGDSESVELTEYINSIYPAHTNKKDSQALRFAKLFNTSLTHLVYDPVKKRFDFNIRPSHLYTVTTEDENIYKLKELMYDYYTMRGGKQVIETVYWSDEKHYKLDQYGNEIAIEGNEEKINPYGILPFARLMIEDCNDTWGDGANDVANVNEQVNVLITQLVNDNIIMGTAGTILGVNLGLHTKGRQDQGDGLRRVRTGKKYPLTVEGARKDMVEPKLEHVTSDPFINDVTEAIDWYIKMLAATKGINPNSFLQEAKATSGYSKLIDSLEQMEVRKDDIAPCKMYESERFEILRKMNNYLVSTADGRGLKTIPEEARFVVDFAEIELPQTQEEIQKEREFELVHNMSTPIDWLKEKNPDLTDEQAEELIRANKEFNDTLKQEPNKYSNLFRKKDDTQTA